MLFNSFEFLLFFLTVFAGYWLLRRRLSQNLLLLIASYVFYAWWDWRFLVILVGMSAAAHVCACLAASQSDKRTIPVWIICLLGLGTLGLFKYFNFFSSSFSTLFACLGISWSPVMLKLGLPVGISFFTFKAISYVIDCYQGKIEPSRSWIDSFLYVGFFPQVLAGPIDRASSLLSQFKLARRFDYALAIEGCRQMLWGFFKKVAVADTCATVTTWLLEAEHPSSISLVVGVLCFSFQIYADFSGYSDIAIGCAKLFGIRTMRNFACPYFSRDIAEFWRRWHISLLTWFRDYLYIPLGGSRCGKRKKLRNTFIVFLVSGLWHGANWTFVVWGMFHAFCFVPLLVFGKNGKRASDGVNEMRLVPSLDDVLKMVFTFSVVAFGWIFFRADSIAQAFSWISMILSCDFHLADTHIGFAKAAVAPVLVMVVWEWISRGREIIWLPSSRVLRWLTYYTLFVLVVYWQPAQQKFIYFQF